MEVQRVLLVVAEHFKHDGLALDVLNKRLCNFDRNLLQQIKKKEKGFDKLSWNKIVEAQLVCVGADVCVRSHSGRGKSPEELLCQCFSEARWKKPHRDGARN